MASKSALLEAGLFDPSLSWAQDYDMILKLARANEFRYIPEKLYGYRRYPGNTRNSIPLKDRMCIEASIMEKHYRQSRNLLSPEQEMLANRRLMDRYYTSGQYLPLLEKGLASPANLAYLARGLVRMPLRMLGA